MSHNNHYGPYLTYGPNENCTLALCPVSASLLEYLPSVAANATFIALFALSLSISVVQSIKWRTWTYLGIMSAGCVAEIIGYAGRLILHKNPFSFKGFIIQIVCITIAPVYFSAAIYTMLSKIVTYLGPSSSLLPPKWYYYIFIPCDVVSLALQASGGAMSSNSTGQNKLGVNISLAGLSFQVVTLTVFCGLAIDFAIRWSRSEEGDRRKNSLPLRFKIFIAFLTLATILILIRCAYRIDELSDGYDGPLIHDEGEFIGLEGVMIIVAAFALNIAHPGPVFDDSTLSSRSFTSPDGVRREDATQSEEMKSSA